MIIFYEQHVNAIFFYQIERERYTFKQFEQFSGRSNDVN